MLSRARRCLGNALCSSSSCASSRMMSSGSTTIVHSDLAYRALLRNLGLLAGMRKGRRDFRAAITGIHASEVAGRMRAMEPAVSFDVAGADERADFGGMVAGSDLDSVIVCQAYHTLHSGGGERELQVVRNALHDEEGTLGLIWHRPTDSGDWLAAFSQAAMASGQAATTGLVAPMQPKDTPLSWVASLQIERFKFRAFRHRKFVERLTGSVQELLPILRLTHDARFPATGPSEAFEAASKAALGSPDAKGRVALNLDLHSFIATVVPVKPPAASAKPPPV